MEIAVITAMPEEFRAVAGCLGSSSRARLGQLNAKKYKFGRHGILLVESGMGFDNAARAAESIISEAAPDLLVSAGFCGGIAAELQVGDVVVASRMVMVSGNSVDPVPSDIPAAVQSLAARQTACGKRIFSGTFCSTAVITSKAKLSGLLSGSYPCPVVEMESAAIAQVAVGSRIPVIGLRSVSDPAGEELGFSLDEFCDSSLRISSGRVLMTILRKPRIIPQLIRLAGNSRIAARSLTAAMKELLARL
jgi:adenosylhomocysteine nucleosidase